MKGNLLNNMGSVDDIKCSLGHFLNNSKTTASDKMMDVTLSLGNELSNRNRSTVVKLLQSAKKKLEKQIQSMLTRCEKADWSCPYHACMSDDCQKAIVLAEGNNLGRAHCLPQEVITKINVRAGRIWVRLARNPEDTVTRKALLADYGEGPLPENIKRIIGMDMNEACKALSFRKD